jgi:poly(A) polymerase
MRLAAASWQEQPGMRALLRALDADEGQTRYVGGSVRDSLLGLEVNDIDLATRLQPEKVIDRLKQAHIKAVPTGLAHGTVTAILADGPVEVTTLRRDVATDGRRATIAYTDDWKEDAARRDFTINALFADPTTLEVIDYFDGETDLAERRLRFIGDPLTRIAEDHLRILRFFRFHARFGREPPDPAALEACIARANDLMALSRERIADELLKLLGLPDPTATITLMVEHGILRPVLPEIDGDSVARLKILPERERDAGVRADPLRRLAALLPTDPGLAASVAARLRLSKKAASRLTLAAGRDSADADNPEALAYRLGAGEATDRILLGEGGLETARSLQSWSKPHFPLTGGDLIGMGLSPGPIVARTLQAIERRWIEEGFQGDTEKLRTLARDEVAQTLRASQ